MRDDYETLLTSQPDPDLLVITINRPDVRNAMNTQLGVDLLDLFSWINLDPAAKHLRCVILTGAGDKAFCAGGDLKERNGMTDEQWIHQHEIFEHMLVKMIDCPIPVIAAVNGSAFGGGCEISAALDFVYAVRGALFAQTEVRLGIIPGAGGTQNLARALGERRAKEVVMSAQPFTAEQAYEWGLVNKLCDADSLMDDVLATARAIAANAPLAVKRAKKAIHAGMQTDLKTGLDIELEAYYRLISTEDRDEGVKAFNEKRTPVFKGR